MMKKRFFKKNKPKEVVFSAKPQKKEKNEKIRDKKNPMPGKADRKMEFPRIYRIIPEATVLKPKKSYLQTGLVGILVALALTLNWFALKNLLGVGNNWVAFIANRQQLFSQMKLWESVTKEYPQYRDAYVEGALYAYRLGDRQKEQYFLQNLELVDPNFPLTKTLGQLMNLQITAGN